jgi:hypothetical protein
MDNIDKDKNKEAQSTTGRVIWFDPNKANNVMVNPEDLSIAVEFRSYRKGRSIIIDDVGVQNTSGGDAVVNFIEGSRKSSKNEERSLTTRYTNGVSLEIMNAFDDQSGGSTDDYESLGIESIDIEFNTAYTPIIKIKFIDVRGNAILSKGNSSKYRMFFDLPYPLFSLTVKGFYGKAVTYCLHLQRWNANFNSETGNFEIQADFIGYTYALLTDMIIGLIRAVVKTDRGQELLRERSSQDPTVIEIGDLLKKLQEVNFSFGKIDDENSEIKQLQSFGYRILFNDYMPKNMEFKNRKEAELFAIEAAFEILEKQLTPKENTDENE